MGQGLLLLYAYSTGPLPVLLLLPLDISLLGLLCDGLYSLAEILESFEGCVDHMM